MRPVDSSRRYGIVCRQYRQSMRYEWGSDSRRAGGLLLGKGCSGGGLEAAGGHARQLRAKLPTPQQHRQHHPQAEQGQAVQYSGQYKRTSKKMDVAEIFLVSVW